ncbi:MAG: hypothetical protein ACOY31_06305 [Bacillota bacterium]
MWNRLKRITLITGSLGSGKTEVAINMALNLAGQGNKTSLVDLDIINPYFRSRLVKKPLERMGIRVITPRGQLASADLPAISPEVKGVIEDTGVKGVFDIGGDDIGARALGRYRDSLGKTDFYMLMVVNTCRPFTRDAGGIIRQMKSIVKASGIPVNGLVNNANLGPETDIKTVKDGLDTVNNVSRQTGIPVFFTVVGKKLESEAVNILGGETDILAVDLFMKPPWDV